MSNALYLTSLAYCRQSEAGNSAAMALYEFINKPMLTLYAIGVCLLAVWMFRRLLTPAKLMLRNTPGRAFRMEPVQVFFLSLAIFFCQSGVGALAAINLKHFFPENSPAITVIPAAIACAVTIAASLVLAAYVFRFAIRRGLGLSFRHWLFDTARGLIAYLAVLPICAALLLVFSPLVPQDERTHQMLKILDTAAVQWQVLTVIVTVLLAPIAEELLFRGLIQSSLRQLTGNAWAGIAITSVLFALVHAPLWHTMPSLFVLAVAIGYNYERCGRIYPAILIHMLFNAVSIADYLGLISLGN